MSQFQFSARNNEGQAISGVVEAATVEAAAEVLRERQLLVVNLREKTTHTLVEYINQWLNRISHKEITFFARQLAVMVGATIPMVKALRVLSRQTNNEYFRTLLSRIAADVDGGSKLSQALAKYPKIFDAFFIHMIRSGETTGRLDKVLEYLAIQKEKEFNLRGRVRGAMIYPIFIVSVMLIVSIVMLIFVVPSLTSIFAGTGVPLPWTTQLLVNISAGLRTFWWLVILLVVVLAVGLNTYIRTPQGQYAFDLAKIKMPIFGRIYQQIALSRLCVSLAQLLGSGVSLPRSLTIVADVINNRVYHDILQHAIREVESGHPLSASFGHYTIIPPILTQMTSVGEETGRLDEILSKLGQFYSQEVDNNLAILTSLIEPIIIILLGLAAGILVTGILSPIYQAASGIA